MKLQGVILAAGKGTRLHPLTLDRSKAMMPIAGKPMIDWVMDGLKSAGLEEFILVVHPDDIELINFYAANKNIKIVHQTERKGAAHALNCAASLISGDFILTACDNLVENEFTKKFVENFSKYNAGRKEARLALIKTSPEKMKSMGMVIWDGEKIEQIIEKPALENVLSDNASIPLYGLPYEFLQLLPKVRPSKRGELELQDAIQMMIIEGTPFFGEMMPGRKTVTDAHDLLEINIEFLRKNRILNSKPTDKKVTIQPPCYFENGITIGEKSQIGPDVIIEKGTTIGKSCIISSSIILRNSNIPDGAVIHKQVIN